MTNTDGLLLDLENTFVRDLRDFSLESTAEAATSPSIVALNQTLAEELGLDPDAFDTPDGVGVLSGNATPPGATPVAMAYAGHQFGGFSPRLGDGRAILLGEIVDTDGERRDLHLKGSGRTPFTRGGDGKAALAPMLREFLIAEAMHALDVPTTRALAVVATGEDVIRQTLEPGAVLTRVAASHLRVGTFEYAARVVEDPEATRLLADYCIARHYPHVAAHDSPYLAFYTEVVEAQAQLIARWMLVGFIHGVMNTDNMTISGEGIDYGPCAFMDQYDPATVFSSIDHGGRYAYGNQPRIAQWNLARLAETLVPLVDPDHDVAAAALTEVLMSFTERFQDHWMTGMRTKLGLVTSDETDDALLDDMLAGLQEHQLDFTSFFRSLAVLVDGANDEDGGLPSALQPWIERWQNRIANEGRDTTLVAKEMNVTNPVYIPRNHLVDAALDAATAGDLAPFEELLDIVTDPFTTRVGHERFAEPAPADFQRGFRTFCGT